MPTQIDRTIKWLSRASLDLDRQFAYIDAHDPRAAAKAIDAVRTAVNRLSRFPMNGRLGRVTGTRELVVSGTQFIVIYRIAETTVSILRVMHSAQRWPPP